MTVEDYTKLIEVIKKAQRQQWSEYGNGRARKAQDRALEYVACEMAFAIKKAS